MDEVPGMIRVHTLGRFHVSVGNRQVLEVGGGMNKMWNVFKYLLINRHMSVPGEALCETFWPGVPWKKARHSLYNIIYRLRILLEDNQKESGILCIRDGLHSLRPNASLWLDADQFQEFCTEAHSMGVHDRAHAMKLLGKALSLYQGDYLAENFYDDWVKGAQERYRAMYRKAVTYYMDLLMEQREFLEACEIANQALALEPLDEDVQLRRISALSQMGNLQEARNAYQSFASLLHQQSGVSPRRDLRDVYREIEALSSDPPVTDLEGIKELLNEQKDNGPVLCDATQFGELYQLEQKRLERSCHPSFMIKVDLSKRDFSRPSGPELELAAKQLEKACSKALRKGDVICRWNDEQFLLLLPNVLDSNVKKVMQRVRREFQSVYPGRVVLRTKEGCMRPGNPLIDSAQGN